MTRIAKAIVAFATTTAGVTATVFADGTVEVAEVIIAACTVIAATAGVWTMPNTPPAGEPADPRVSEQHIPTP